MADFNLGRVRALVRKVEPAPLTPRQSAQSVSLGGGWKEAEELGIQSDGDEKDGGARHGAIKYRTYQPTPQLSRSQ
jgi:hypothetical protein